MPRRLTLVLDLMDIRHVYGHFWTTFIEDTVQGCAGFQLHRESSGKRVVVGQTTYWDATGGFVFNTFDGADVPVEVVEAAIAEARREIKTR